MRNTFRLASVVVLLAGLAACTQVAPQGPALQPSAQSATRTLSYVGTSSFQSSTQATSIGFQSPELPPGEFEHDVAAATDQFQAQSASQQARGNRIVNRTLTKQQVPFTPPTGTSSQSLSTQALASTALTFEGLNHFQQRYADSGNQFSLEPPDQGLCVGNGHVLEAVNDVLNVYDTSGNVELGVVSLNQFYGFKSAINRTNFKFGAFVTDPSCLFDAGSQRWFLTVLTLGVNQNSGAFTGQNELDIAVSQTADPLGDWTIYSLDVTNDGSGCPCLGDYPHIGASANGFVITTDNFPFFTAGYNGAWVYAFDKGAMADSARSVTAVGMPITRPGTLTYMVWPATSVGTQYVGDQDGTQYFMSSDTSTVSAANDILVWALSGTDTLASAHPSLSLSSTAVKVRTYGDPPVTVPQKSGDVPLAEALNHDLFGYGTPPNTQTESGVAANGSGMKQVVYVNGQLWGALTTGVTNGRGRGTGGTAAGAAWFRVTPRMSHAGVSAKLSSSGVISVQGSNFIFPAITVNADGKGVIAGTLVGPNDYPSAAYVPVGSGGTGRIVVAHAGGGPQDGFSGYGDVFGGTPRWGDYGAGAADEAGNLWIASEDIHQTCDYATYVASNGTCGNTRSYLANWSTQITKVVP